VFDIGSPELLMIAVVALLVLGPDRMPEALRAMAKGWGTLRRAVNRSLSQIQEEIGFDRIRQQLDEEGVIGEIKAVQIELNELTGGTRGGLTELEKPMASSDSSHWPGMPPPDTRA
jgi:sec-independent protein translocase protein TatB